MFFFAFPLCPLCCVPVSRPVCAAALCVLSYLCANSLRFTATATATGDDYVAPDMMMAALSLDTSPTDAPAEMEPAEEEDMDVEGAEAEGAETAEGAEGEEAAPPAEPKKLKRHCNIVFIGHVGVRPPPGPTAPPPHTLAPAHPRLVR